ncbi:oxidoreductase [Pigmentiphaga litoralis]|uniref:(2Fe-2S)-binding protein n=1 Tax=Pigmentiphaga litoralis TaxID=516702 RepID=UPI0019A0229C|nr:(2Fe-2S)-binding protein [Pigmentiphaga litoralis]GGX23834.1 oxidoreductase [Pigmentiphaga litoralis]
MNQPDDKFKPGRRSFLGYSAGAASVAAVTGCASVAADNPMAASASPVVGEAASTTQAVQMPMTLDVNGQPRRFYGDVRLSLLDALREKLELTGSKKGCDQGQCGACTVHVDGKRVLGCLTLAVTVQGKKITTIEGLASPGRLHPMQQAFIDHDAFQCGYCTPGQIMSAVAIVNEGHARNDDDIRESMSGNLCRCAAYPNIVDAINDAKGKMAATTTSPAGG